MSSSNSPFKHNAFLDTVKKAYAATPYVLMVPGAVAGGQLAHKKKYNVRKGAIAGGLGTSLGATFGGVGGSVGGILLGKHLHDIRGGTRDEMLRRVNNTGELGAVIGALAGGYAGYTFLMHRFENEQKRGEDHVLKKYNLKRPEP